MEPVIFPENVDNPPKVGDIITVDGTDYQAMEHFSQGKDAKNSGYNYFMFNKRGAIGFKPC